VVNKENSQRFCLGKHRLTVVCWELMLLKLEYISFKNIKFPRGNYETQVERALCFSYVRYDFRCLLLFIVCTLLYVISLMLDTILPNVCI